MKTLQTAFICSESAISLLKSLGRDPKELRSPPLDLQIGDVISFDGVTAVAFVVTKRWISVGNDSDNLYYFVDRTPFPV